MNLLISSVDNMFILLSSICRACQNNFVKPVPQARWALETSDGTPPRLPRPLSKLNCVQARTVLSKMLRYQQGGNNPVYGSPDTQPPWWPDDSIRWIDIVDLRGKPPYTPPNQSYSDVLKQAIGNGCRYYGLDPETYVDEEEMQHTTYSASPVPVRFAPPATSLITNNVMAQQILKPITPLHLQTPVQKQTKSLPRVITVSGTNPATTTTRTIIIQPMGQKLVLNSNSGASVIKQQPMQVKQPVNIPGSSLLRSKQNVTPPLLPLPASFEDVKPSFPEPIINLTEDHYFDPSDIVDDNDEPGMPPRLPKPINEMRCGDIRVALSRLLWFYNNGQAPAYGSAVSMPSWWPDHLMKWSLIKNLSAAYPGTLANTYTNCLRIALIRGYAHYGLDPNSYMRAKSNRIDLLAGPPNVMDSQVAMPIELENYTDTDNRPKKVPVAQVQAKVRKPPPNLIPISQFKNTLMMPKSAAVRKSLCSEPIIPVKTDQSWFPAKLTCPRAIVGKDVLSSLRPCKVSMDRTVVNKVIKRMNSIYCAEDEDDEEPSTRLQNKDFNMLNFLDEDRKSNKTDLTFISKTGEEFPVHRFVAAAHSKVVRELVRDDKDDPDARMSFPGLTSEVMRVLLDALYTGRVTMSCKDKFALVCSGLKVFQTVGLLRGMTLCTKKKVTKALPVKPPQVKTPAVEVEKIKDVTAGTEIEVVIQKDVDEDEPLAKKRSIRRSRGATAVAEEKPTPPTRKRGRRRRSSDDSKTPPTVTKRSRRLGRSSANKPIFGILTHEAVNEHLEAEGGERKLLEWLMEDCNLLLQPGACTYCSEGLQLLPDDSCVDKLSWSCPNIESGAGDHVTGQSPRLNSVFEKSPEDSLSMALKTIVCWKENTSLGECQQLTGADVETVFKWYDMAKDFFGAPN